MALYAVTAVSSNPADAYVARDTFFFPVGRRVIADLTEAQATAYGLEAGWTVVAAHDAEVADDLTAAAARAPDGGPSEPGALPCEAAATLPPRAVDPTPIPYAEEI